MLEGLGGVGGGVVGFEHGRFVFFLWIERHGGLVGGGSLLGELICY